MLEGVKMLPYLRPSLRLRAEREIP